ncbi:MAG: hypothetical protein WCR19_01680 [Acholeplasmataceae bacterium]
MICEICKLKIKTKKTLFNLFDEETHHICEACFMKYPLYVQYQVIPLDYGLIHWYSLLRTKDDISGLAYMSFLKPFYLDYVKNVNDSIFLYFDKINDRIMTILQSLEYYNIYLVTLYDEIK